MIEANKGDIFLCRFFYAYNVVEKKLMELYKLELMKLSIVGGGIAGLTTAIALKERGISSTIFESSPKLDAIGAGLGLGANAIRAFEKIGLGNQVMSLGRILSSFTIYDQKGKIITHTNNAALTKKYGVNNFTIHRAALQQFLLSKIDSACIYTNRRATGFTKIPGGIKIIFSDGSMHESNAVIVADGIHSVLRKKLLPDIEPRYAGYTCWRAVVDNSSLNLSETSETWGVTGRFGIVPLADNKIYWFACMNAPQNDPAMKHFTIADLQKHFNHFHQPIPDILQHTKDENLIWNDIIDLPPLKKYAHDNIVLIGDAAHATTPNMGQGACQAIEDAVILADELHNNSSPALAFRQFEQRRLQRTHYITNTSRSIGKIAQLDNPWLASIRNALFSLMPASFNERQLEKICKVDF